MTAQRMHLQQYLERIDYHGDVRPELPFLLALQRRHVCTVPFENLDVQLGHSVSTRVEDAYRKVVVDGRGGWCYTQNGLFGWALSEIGFDVTRVAASVMRQERGKIADSNHLCLLVRCADTADVYLVDVGFGGSMITPIPLQEAAYDQPPFRIGLTSLGANRWRFWEDLGKGAFSYDFSAVAADEAALAEKCEFLQSDPASIFVLNLVAQARSPEAHKSLRGRVLTTATSAGVQSCTLHSGAEIVATLAEHFRLDVPDVAELWPRIAARHEEHMRSLS